MRYSEGGLVLSNRMSDSRWISLGKDAIAKSAETNADPRKTNIPEDLFSIVPVIGAVRFLCRLVSGCEIHVVERVGNTLIRTFKDLPKWTDEEYQPNDHQNASDFLDFLTMNMLLGW